MPHESHHAITVLVSAPYASVRAGLCSLLDADPGLTVVGEAPAAVELDRVASQLAPDVILIDYTEGEGRAMVDMSMDDGAAVVALGVPSNQVGRLLAKAHNGLAVLLKEAEAEEIITAVRAAFAGLVTLDQSLASSLAALAEPPMLHDLPASASGEPLSARERDVLQHLAQGLPNKQIATKLGISQHTVKFHVASILAKLGAGSRTEAVTIGARHGDVML